MSRLRILLEASIHGLSGKVIAEVSWIGEWRVALKSNLKLEYSISCSVGEGNRFGQKLSF
jgi:hypothetical protein